MSSLLSGAPGARLGPALCLSLLLHLALLLPWPAWRTAPRIVPPMRVQLPPATVEAPPASELATVKPEREMAPLSPAVRPVTEGNPRGTPTVAPPRPRELKGRALSSALAQLAQGDFYPREAIAQGLEGRVVLLLTLDDDGRVMAVEVASPSGHGLLDQAALRASGRIGRIPGKQQQVLLPVEFRLE